MSYTGHFDCSATTATAISTPFDITNLTNMQAQPGRGKVVENARDVVHRTVGSARFVWTYKSKFGGPGKKRQRYMEKICTAHAALAAGKHTILYTSTVDPKVSETLSHNQTYLSMKYDIYIYLYHG